MNSLRTLFLPTCITILLIFGFVACGNDPTPTPEPAATSPAPTIAPSSLTSRTATDTVTATNEATATVLTTDSAATTNSVSATVLVTEAVSAAGGAEEAMTSTLPGIESQVQSTTTQLVLPVVANASTECAVAQHLDFAGYPDAANLYAVLGCPKSDATLDPVAISEFGTGPNYDRFMLWFSSDKQISVLLPNQTWLSYADTWVEGQPEISCNPNNLAKTSPPLPRRGFGKLWCTVESIQQQMGTIEREERLCQHSVTQRYDKGRLLACFEDATIRYFRILDDGRWDVTLMQ